MTWAGKALPLMTGGVKVEVMETNSEAGETNFGVKWWVIVISYSKETIKEVGSLISFLCLTVYG
jgi:hypothetical protein